MVHVDCRSKTDRGNWKRFHVVGWPWSTLDDHINLHDNATTTKDLTWTNMTHLGLWMWTNGEFVMHFSVTQEGHWVLPSVMLSRNFLRDTPPVVLPKIRSLVRRRAV